MRRTNCNVLSAPSNASQNGLQINANQIYSASFQATFGNGDEAGTFKLQASNDICPEGPQEPIFVVTNWTDVPGSLVTIASGASAIITLGANSTPYRWLRAVYTRTSGGAANKSVVVNMLSQSV